MRYRVEVKTADGWVEVGSTDDRKQLPALIGKAIDYPYRFGLRVTDAKTGKRLMDGLVPSGVCLHSTVS